MRERVQRERERDKAVGSSNRRSRIRGSDSNRRCSGGPLTESPHTGYTPNRQKTALSLTGPCLTSRRHGVFESSWRS
eukprot:11397935-Heterocapsa_arctica.AAC.1